MGAPRGGGVWRRGWTKPFLTAKDRRRRRKRERQNRKRTVVVKRPPQH